MPDTSKASPAILIIGVIGLTLILFATFYSPKGTTDMSAPEKQNANRLLGEKSPYLLQHAYNPVDWYPWGEEAFAKAAAEDKPIFLSIGYSTCHWCHVMEHESFEDSSVAALMNKTFINIKVDREERPDVDDVYMTVCQMMTGSGGWPLTILMTPDKRPFYAATYIPRESHYNRPGMLDLIPRIGEVWKTERDKIFESAQQIETHLQKSIDHKAGEVLGQQLLDVAFSQFEKTYDAHYGGFNQKPKFPTPHNMMFLLRYHQRTGQAQALQMVDKTLTEMRYGGLYDHVGKGFHRYSTDEKWLLPHFEKMLYDQAMLLFAYLEGFQANQNPLFRQTAEDILTYVLRDMTSPEGGFYAAEDADSEGEEGKFYVWSRAEVLDVLGKADGEWFSAHFNISADGNFHDEATGEAAGVNIPHLVKSYASLAAAEGVTEEKFQQRAAQVLKRLFDHREKRIHPLKDDKVLTDWNGLMIAASARAGRVLNNPAYVQASAAAFAFVEKKLLQENGKLLHRYRDGEAAIGGFLDDYAFMIWGAIELFEATGEPQYLQKALQFTDIAIANFWDDQNGAFFFTAQDAEELLVRKKEIYDGAIPSGNSVMMLNLLRLARLSGNMVLENRSADIGRAFSNQVTRYPAGHTLLMSALDFSIGPVFEVVVAAKAGESGKILAALNQPYLPNKVLVIKNEANAAELAKVAPYTKEMAAGKDSSLIYVCRNFACQLPVSSAEEALKFMQ